jgi:GT2 family glycosyltransferase
LDRYPEVARARHNPLLHFLRFGGLEGRRPHPDFDAAYYLRANPDVVSSRINPLVHFLQHGAREGRLPNPDFDREYYCLTHPDVAATGVDPVQHFATEGAGTPTHPGSRLNPSIERFLPVAGPQVRQVDNRSVDVIIPVYRGLAETRACLESVLGSSCSVGFRVIVVNDCSPDAEISAYLRRMADQFRITLIENPHNQGFAMSANAGMRASDRDVLLLNSDTIVFDRWLDRLTACAYSEARTGTVTPFSNNATICSYPLFCHDNIIPRSIDLRTLDAEFESVNIGRSVEIPTAVGFCMYIRRDCLNETGGFDAEAFGLGYGEENDFCMRAARKGWKHLLACDVFVYHHGSVSFGQASELRRETMRILTSRHPDYGRLVRRHIEADPAAPYRMAVTLGTLRRSGLRVFLAVLHGLSGGLAQSADELMKATTREVLWLTLRPVSPRQVRLECAVTGYQFSITLEVPRELDYLPALLASCGTERVHIHHLMGYEFDVAALIQKLGLPFDFTVHDYYCVCPQITLSDEQGRYCGEPGNDECNRCLQRRPVGTAYVDIAGWRSRNAWVFNRASRLIAPSVDVAERIARYNPGARLIAAEHLGAQEPHTVVPPHLENGQPMRIAVLGAMTTHKGCELLEACAAAARRTGQLLEFLHIGSLERRLKHPSFLSTGFYQLLELPGQIERFDPHLIWFPARCPETFSYTLSTCLELGRPLAAHAIGAFPERVGGRPWTWIVPVTYSAQDWLHLFERIRQDHFVPHIGSVAPPKRPRGRTDFYSQDYLTAG